MSERNTQIDRQIYRFRERKKEREREQEREREKEEIMSMKRVI